MKQGLEHPPQGAQELMRWKMASLARAGQHSSMNTIRSSIYHNYISEHAIIAQFGLQHNLPDAIYPMNLGNKYPRTASTAPNNYTIHWTTQLSRLWTHFLVDSTL